MAKAMMKMPEDFLMKVSKLESKTDEILPRVLESGAEVVESKVQTNLSAVIGKDTKFESRSTGSLNGLSGLQKLVRIRMGIGTSRLALMNHEVTGTPMQRLPISSNMVVMAKHQDHS